MARARSYLLEVLPVERDPLSAGYILMMIDAPESAAFSSCLGNSYAAGSKAAGLIVWDF